MRDFPDLNQLSEENVANVPEQGLPFMTSQHHSSMHYYVFVKYLHNWELLKLFRSRTRLLVTISVCSGALGVFFIKLTHVLKIPPVIGEPLKFSTKPESRKPKFVTDPD